MRIFISYRRADNAAGYSRSLAIALRREFGEDEVFRDIRSIAPGENFPDVLERVLSGCEVMLVLIGTQWPAVEDADGSRRLENPTNWVRREVAAALRRDILVVPVLVCGASMPRADTLPEDLAPLATRNAFAMSDDDWEYDVTQLVAALRRHLDLPATAGHSDADVAAHGLAEYLRYVTRRVSARRRFGAAMRMRRGLLRWTRIAGFIVLVLFIGYTQNDPFAAGVDRLLSSSGEVLARLAPWCNKRWLHCRVFLQTRKSSESAFRKPQFLRAFFCDARHKKRPRLCRNVAAASQYVNWHCPCIGLPARRPGNFARVRRHATCIVRRGHRRSGLQWRERCCWQQPEPPMQFH